MKILSNLDNLHNNSKKSFYNNVLIAIGIFLLFLGIYYFTSGILWELVSHNQNLIFGADTRETIELLEKITFENDAQKHLLFSATLSIAAKVIYKLTTVSQIVSIRLILAIVGSINTTGVFLFLKKISNSTLHAVVFMGLYAFFYSNLVLFSIPETYSMSNFFILIYLAILVFFRKSLNVYKCMLLSVISGIASLYNPVLLSLMGIHFILSFFHGDRKRWIIIVISNLFIGLSIYFIAIYIVYGADFLPFAEHYANKYASLYNFLNIYSILNVFSNFYFFSIISPTPYLTSSLCLADWNGYLVSPFMIVMIIFWGIYLFYSIVISLSQNNENKTLLISILGWMLFITLFYIYFNPDEAILYSSQILFPLIIILSLSFRTIKIKDSVKYSFLGLFLLFITQNNIITYISGIK